MEVLPDIFNMASYVCMCKFCKVIVFIGGRGWVYFFCSQTTREIVFWGFWKVDFLLFRLKNEGSITWPHFCQHFWVDLRRKKFEETGQTNRLWAKHGLNNRKSKKNRKYCPKTHQNVKFTQDNVFCPPKSPWNHETHEELQRYAQKT